MTGSPMAAIQAAVYTVLNGDTGAGGLRNPTSPLVQGVFDAVPDNQALPYVVIGDQTETPFDTMGKYGAANLLTVHAWSEAAGYKEAQGILSRLNYLLDGVALTITGYSHVGTVYDGAETVREPDGVTRHIIARYRVYVQES